MRASIVIPVWNGRQWLPTCLDSVLEQAGVEVEIIAVDNASKDDSAELIASTYPQVRLIRSPSNRGFSGGCNLGIKASQAEILILLNQDTSVRPGWLTSFLQTFADDLTVGIVGGKGLYPDGQQIQHAGGWLAWPRGIADHYGHREPDDGRWDAQVDVEYVTGAAMGIRREVVERIGLLDESFWPGYYEDVDYCLRAQAAGYKVRYCPQAVYFHAESTSTPAVSQSYYIQRGRLRLVLKHLSAARLLEEFLPAEADEPLVIADRIQTRALRLAYLDTLLNLPVLLRERGLEDESLVEKMLNAFQMMHRRIWLADLHGASERGDAADGLILNALQPAMLANGLLPEYFQQVQARRGSPPSAEETWLGLREYVFHSSIPLLGPLITRFREWGFNLVARWPLLYLMQQQEAINQQLGQRLLNLAEENALLALELTRLKKRLGKESDNGRPDV